MAGTVAPAADGIEGKASVKGRVTTLQPTSALGPLGLPVIVQLLADDLCLGATFTTASVNEPTRLKAKNGQ